MELNVNPETVLRLAELARHFHAQEQVVIPDDPQNPSGDWAAQMLAAHDGDATLEEFRGIIEDLEPDQLLELIALFWVGREAYAPEEWEEALEAAVEEAPAPVADYLIGHPLLADDLLAGLEALGYPTS